MQTVKEYIKSQLLKIPEGCSFEVKETHLNAIYAVLQSRNYPNHVIAEAIQEVLKETLQELVQKLKENIDDL